MDVDIAVGQYSSIVAMDDIAVDINLPFGVISIVF